MADIDTWLQAMRRSYLLGALVTLACAAPAYAAVFVASDLSLAHSSHLLASTITLRRGPALPAAVDVAWPPEGHQETGGPPAPMRPRFADPRIALLTKSVPMDAVENGTLGDSTATPPRPTRYVQRFRLDKRHSGAAVADVVKPIVFYIAQDIPRHWVPWIKRGVEAWQPVFEAIGFRNAIIAQEAPVEAQDPAAWRQFVATHCVILWDPKYQGGGAYVTGIKVDPRSGEVLAGKIILKGPTEQILHRQAFAYFGARPDVPVLLPDSILEPAFAAVVTHEVGHMLGLDHNFKATSTYPTDSLRSATFVRRMGITPSVMDYVYFNSVAHFQDNIPLRDRVARIGPYDRFAVHWAYRPILNAATPEAELTTLEEWRKAQDTAAYLRAPVPVVEAITDPGVQLYDLGADLVKSARAIVRNLAAAGTRLTALRRTLQATPMPADTSEQSLGEGQRQRPRIDLDLATQYQAELLKAWGRAVRAPIALLGGSEPVAPYARESSSQRFAPVDSARQVAALRLLLAVVRGQDELVQALVLASGPAQDVAVLAPDTLPDGWSLQTVRQHQLDIMSALLTGERLGRIVEQSTTLRTGVLSGFCTELESLRRDLSVVAPTKAPATLKFLATLRAQLERATTSQESACRQHGWSPTP